MKTSNKLILVIFLLAVLLPVLVVATILVRYRSGSFTWQKEGEYDRINLSLTDGQHLTLRGITRLTIHPSDSLFASVNKYGLIRVKEQRSGDSVLLYGDTTYYRYDTLENGTVNKQLITENSYDEMQLFLPPHFDLKLENCEHVYLKEHNAGKPVENITLHLSNTELMTNGYHRDQPTPIGSLTLKMEKAEAQLSSLPPVTDLDVSLSQESKLSISGLEVQNLRVTYDSSSVLTATGQQLKKIIQKK